MAHQDGTWRNLYSFERPFLRNDDNTVKQKIGVAIDVTERRKAETALQAYHDQLEEKVIERTDELRQVVNLMAGREVRMAELKTVIQQLCDQLRDAGLTPIASDPLLSESPDGLPIDFCTLPLNS